MRTWILVADSAQATIYCQNNAKEHLSELTSMEHLEARAHDGDLTTDKSGRSFDSGGGGRHSMEQRTQPKKQSTINFAKRLAIHLDQGRQNGEFGQLVLFAAPGFLGLLRAELSAPLKRQIVFESSKDLVREDIQSIRAHLPEGLHRTL